MNKKRLVNVIFIKNFSITPVEQLRVANTPSSHDVSFSVIYEPLGIIIEHDGIQWALDMTGKQISMADLFSPDERSPENSTKTLHLIDSQTSDKA